MSISSDGSVNSASGGPKPVRRRQTNVRTLIVLVASCAVILWSLRNLWENYDPVRVESRALQRKAIAALRSAKPDERLTAVQELERLHAGDTASSIPALIGALEDTDSTVRLAAAAALDSICSMLAKSGSAEGSIQTAATALIRCVKNQDTEIRVVAVKALGSIGDGLVKSRSGGQTVGATATALIGCLKDPDADVRAAAANALGEIASHRPALLATRPFDRRVVMDALAEMLGDRDAKVRRAAIHALSSRPMGNGDPPQALALGLKDEVAQNRRVAVAGFNFFDQGLDPWVPILLQIAEQDPDPAVHDQCLTTLNFGFKPPALTAAVVPALTASLRSGNAKVRSMAASKLSLLKADALAAIPELLRVLNEPLDPNVEAVLGPSMNLDPASAAAQALGRIAPGSAEAKQVIAGLMETVRSGPVSRRGWASFALGEFGPAAKEAVPVLIKDISEAAPDGTFERASSAAVALGKIAPVTPWADQAVAALLPVLESKAWLDRAKAIDALREFGPRAAAAIPRIRALKTDRDLQVREAAVKALAAIQTKGAP